MRIREKAVVSIAGKTCEDMAFRRLEHSLLWCVFDKYLGISSMGD